MILIDTNIFLELIYDQEKASDCEALLNVVSNGEEEAVASHFSIHAVEALIGGREGHLVDFLRDVENSRGLYIHETNLSDEIAACLLSRNTKLDFDDSLQYYLAKKIGASAIVSFDRHFDGLDVQRLEPAEVLAPERKD